jgi:hypothetical protein
MPTVLKAKNGLENHQKHLVVELGFYWLSSIKADRGGHV